MERENKERIGYEVGSEGVERLVDQVENVCLHERRRIEFVSAPKIVSLQMELGMWADEEKRIRERLRSAPPPGDRRSRRRNAWFAAGIALVLTVAGFFFSLLAFDPFRLGWKSYLYCVGIAIVSPYCIERCLEAWDCRRLITVLATFAGTAAITSLILLAVIRGDLFSQELKESETPVVVTDESRAVPQDDNHFYEQALPLLQLVMALLAVAMELGAGLAFHDAKRFGTDSGEDSETVAKELIAVRMKMATVGSQIIEYANEGAVFEERFWRDFCHTMLTHTKRRALGKLLTLGLCILFLAPHVARADEPRLNLIVLIDLSASVASKGPDGRTDFEKNVTAVTELLASVPAGSHVTILGITGNSFGEPDILLRANVPRDAGYFGERLAAAHQQVVRAWHERSARVVPDAKQTDILGALLVASQLFGESTGEERKVLVIYSDMRQATPELSLERHRPPSAEAAPIMVERNLPVPDLKAVEVDALGVDAAGRNAAGWECLRQFWESYFIPAGTHLRSFTVLRGLPGL